MILFALLSLLVLISAVFMILSRQVMYSVFFMIVCMFGIALHFLLLGAIFLGLIQIIVYSGAIMILFIFVVMLLDLRNEAMEKTRKISAKVLTSGVLSLAVFFGSVFLLFLLYGSKFSGFFSDGSSVKQNTPFFFEESVSIQDLGFQLFTSYLLPFELISVLFLSAMIGTVLLVKRWDAT